MIIDAKRLKEILNSDLPGWAAQQLMSPAKDPRYRQLPDDYRKAAVMALLYPDAVGNYCVILIERAKHNSNDKHAGQIGFPGGKYETDDGDMLTCALREVEEEIGIAAAEIDVLGPLSELFVFASNFLVQPFVGVLADVPSYTIQESEVHSVLDVPLSVLMDQHTQGVTDIIIRDQKITDVPYYDVNGKVLWGATAMMMSELQQAIVTASYCPQ